ncbi:PspC domain-containing protein [candidate division GN15 bacterium]|nr:PspC domain-containing protein [candidate division GN15 bacterium]
MEQPNNKQTNTGPRRLYRSRNDTIIGGVCGGLGEYLEIDPVIVRIVAVLLLFTGWGLLAYIVAWIIMPVAPEGYQPPATEGGFKKSTYLPGFFLIVIGVLIILQQHWYWFDLWELWPLLLIAVGLVLIFRSWGRRNQSDEYNEPHSGHHSSSDSGGPNS